MNGSTPAAGDLPSEREALVLVSAAHASGDEAALRRALLEAAATAGREPVEEVLLQAYLFLGFRSGRSLDRSRLDLGAGR